MEPAERINRTIAARVAGAVLDYMPNAPPEMIAEDIDWHLARTMDVQEDVAEEAGLSIEETDRAWPTLDRARILELATAEIERAKSRMKGRHPWDTGHPSASTPRAN